MNAILPHLIIRLPILAILVLFVSCGSSADPDSKEIEMHASVATKPKEDDAKLLLGTHDFSTFRASSCGAKSPIKTMEKISIRKKKKK